MCRPGEWVVKSKCFRIFSLPHFLPTLSSCSNAQVSGLAAGSAGCWSEESFGCSSSLCLGFWVHTFWFSSLTLLGIRSPSLRGSQPSAFLYTNRHRSRDRDKTCPPGLPSSLSEHGYPEVQRTGLSSVPPARSRPFAQPYSANPPLPRGLARLSRSPGAPA